MKEKVPSFLFFFFNKEEAMHNHSRGNRRTKTKEPFLFLLKNLIF